MFQNGFSSGIQMPTWKNELSTVVSKFLAGLGKYSEHCSVSLESMEIKKKKNVDGTVSEQFALPKIYVREKMKSV